MQRTQRLQELDTIFTTYYTNAQTSHRLLVTKARELILLLADGDAAFVNLLKEADGAANQAKNLEKLEEELSEQEQEIMSDLSAEEKGLLTTWSEWSAHFNWYQLLRSPEALAGLTINTGGILTSVVDSLIESVAVSALFWSVYVHVLALNLNL